MASQLNYLSIYLWLLGQSPVSKLSTFQSPINTELLSRTTQTQELQFQTLTLSISPAWEI